MRRLLVATALVAMAGHGVVPQLAAGAATLEGAAARAAVVNRNGTPHGGSEPSAEITLPTDTLIPAEQRTFSVGVRTTDTSIHAAELIVHYDAAVVSLETVAAGAAASGWLVASNLSTPGVARIALAGSTGYSGTGELLRLTFKALGAIGSTTALTVEGLQVDEGAVPSTVVAGRITITKAVATVALGSLSQTYDGTPRAVTATTTPAGLLVAFSYVGTGGTTYGPSATAPTSIGTYAVTGTVEDAAYQGTASGTLFITTPLVFSDDPLVAGRTRIKAIHITELRQRIEELRARFTLAPFAWTDPALIPGSTVVRAVHVTELRQALHQACEAGGLTVPVYTDPAIVVREAVVARHIDEIRAALRAVW